MALGTVPDSFQPGWDWKGNYVDQLANGEGYERFSQGSLTPDTTLLFAGPARFNASDITNRLHPMGLVDSFQFSTQNQVQPLWEIGSNRTFFTRGKTQNQIQLSAMLADHNNLMRVLTEESYASETGTAQDSQYFLNSGGTKAPGVDGQPMWMNLDSEALAVPFGILMLFKTKGQIGANSLNGDIVGATYLENCMLNNFQFQVQAQSPIIQENVGIQFDRAVPVAIG